MSEATETKTCPFCGETINVNALKCKHCGEWIKKEKAQGENQVYKAFTGIVNVLIFICVIITGFFFFAIGGKEAGIGMGVLAGIIVAICLTIYFLPTTIADNNRHKDTTIIFIINLFFGGTVIGWVVALIWALKE